MSLLRFLVDVNVGLAVADSLRESGHDVTFGDQLPSRFCVYREGRLRIR